MHRIKKLCQVRQGMEEIDIHPPVLFNRLEIWLCNTWSPDKSVLAKLLSVAMAIKTFEPLNKCIKGQKNKAALQCEK